MLFDKLFDNLYRHITINGFRVIHTVFSVLINEFIFHTWESKLNAFIILHSVNSRTTVMKFAGLYRNGKSVITAQPRSFLLNFNSSIIGMCPYRFLQPIFNSHVRSTPFIIGVVFFAIFFWLTNRMKFADKLSIILSQKSVFDRS